MNVACVYLVLLGGCGVQTSVRNDYSQIMKCTFLTASEKGEIIIIKFFGGRRITLFNYLRNQMEWDEVEAIVGQPDNIIVRSVLSVFVYKTVNCRIYLDFERCRLIGKSVSF
jgi:hypothetical protein